MKKMIKVGNIISLFYSTDSGRTSTSELLFDSKGIVKDKHYDQNIDRSVLITTSESYELAKNAGIDVSYGSLGENILIDYNPYHLTMKARLKIGDVVLEISQHCTLCKSLTKVNSKLPKLLKDDRGIFARVIKSGKIKEGDNIYLLE